MSQFKPYPAYKDSGVECLGEIPKDWVKGSLKNMALIRNGKDHKEVESPQGAYPVIGSGGQFSNTDHYLYDGESVLLGRKGTIDKPLYINGRFWTVDTMFYTEVFKEASAKFLYYFALTIPFGFYSTSTALPSMTQGDLSNHPAAIPSKLEQIQIARFLDYETARIDALIEEQKRLIELLQEKRQAVISHAVTKGLDPTVPMKDSGVEWLGEVPAHWALGSIKNLASIRNGKDYKDVESVDGAYPVIGSGGQFANATSYLYDGESVLLGRKGTINKPLYINGRFWTVDTMFYTEVYSAASAKFLYYKALTIPFDYYSTSTALPSMTQHDLLSHPCAIPRLEEQIQIVSFLEHEIACIVSLFEEANAGVALLQERRSALISAAVTGKIDVRDWQPPTDSSAPSAAAQKTCLEAV